MIRFRSFRRSATTVLECLISLVVLGVTVSLVAQGLSFVAAQRRQAERRDAALVEIDQLLERVAVANWEDLRVEQIQAWELSAYFRKHVSNARIVVDVTEETDSPAAKRLSVTLRWPSPSGEESSPFLSLWRYKMPEAQP